jgi:hypothetical protein
MSRQRKTAAVLRLLRGDDLDLVSRSLGVTAATLTGWRDAFLAAGEAALTTKLSTGEDVQSDRLKARLGAALNRLDKVLRWFVVTPDMHRVHHSILRTETDSNFGFNLPWWDRVFGTYRAQPEAGHEGMIIGLLDQFRDPVELRFDKMLSQPFRDGTK